MSKDLERKFGVTVVTDKNYSALICKECGDSYGAHFGTNCLPGKRKRSVVRLSEGLEGLPDYAYKTIEEFEEIVKYKVNTAFRDGWNMARATNKQLRALGGIEKAD